MTTIQNNLSTVEPGDSLTLPSSLNLDLHDYEIALSEWLESADSFELFILKALLELKNMEFTGWSWLHIDIPLLLSTPIGALPSISHQKYGLIHQHYLNNDTCLLESATADSELFIFSDESGEYEFISIPISIGNQRGHALFTLAVRGEKSGYIKKIFLSNRDKLRIIARVINDIGVEEYPDQFLEGRNKFEKIRNGRPLKVLETMARSDCNIVQAAEQLQITRTTADKQIAKIRNYLGASTTHGAVIKAVKFGLIGLNNNSIDNLPLCPPNHFINGADREMS